MILSSIEEVMVALSSSLLATFRFPFVVEYSFKSVIATLSTKQFFLVTTFEVAVTFETLVKA